VLGDLAGWQCDHHWYCQFLSDAPLHHGSLDSNSRTRPKHLVHPDCGQEVAHLEALLQRASGAEAAARSAAAQARAEMQGAAAARASAAALDQALDAREVLRLAWSVEPSSTLKVLGFRDAEGSSSARRCHHQHAWLGSRRRCCWWCAEGCLHAGPCFRCSRHGQQRCRQVVNRKACAPDIAAEPPSAWRQAKLRDSWHALCGQMTELRSSAGVRASASFSGGRRSGPGSGAATPTPSRLLSPATPPSAVLLAVRATCCSCPTCHDMASL
jgi:hypothetical protein